MTVKNLKLTYETGTLVEEFKTVQPDTITVNPPPFAFKALGGKGKFDVNDIRGKLTIDGSSNFESVGDKVIVHNGSGANDNSLITNRQIPRMEVDGKDPRGNNIYKAALDDEGNAINDIFLSLEGFGLDIPDSGFESQDGAKIYGVLLKDVENIDLRMADERPDGTDWSRDDNLIVSMTELRDSSKSSTRNGVFSDGNLKSLTGDEIEKVNLQIVLGDGNDSVILKQITGQTSIYGGQGIDEVTVGDGGDLSGITGGIIFDGDAHIDEVTYDVTWSELQSTTPGPYPDTFANTGVSDKKGSFTGSNGTTFDFYEANLKPILYENENNGKAMVRIVSILPNGEIQQDYVQEKGSHKVNESGDKLYLDSSGKETTSSGGAYPNIPIFETNFETEKYLYYNKLGHKTDVDPYIGLIRDGPGDDVAIYRAINDRAGFGSINVYAGNDGNNWTKLSRVSTNSTRATYNIGNDNLDAYKFIKIVGSGSGLNQFRLDGVELLPGSGGPDNNTYDSRFATSVNSSSIPSTEYAAAGTAGDSLFAYLGNNEEIIFEPAQQVSSPALAQVNRTVPIVYKRTYDQYIADYGVNTADKLTVEGYSQAGDLSGSLDVVTRGVSEIDANGKVSLYDGAKTDEFTLSENDYSFTLTEERYPDSLLQVIRKTGSGSSTTAETLEENEFSITGKNIEINENKRTGALEVTYICLLYTSDAADE